VVSATEPLFFHPSSSSVILTRLSEPLLQTHYFSEYLVVPGIELGSTESVNQNIYIEPNGYKTANNELE
jgi:hypothetical protein